MDHRKHVEIESPRERKVGEHVVRGGQVRSERERRFAELTRRAELAQLPVHHCRVEMVLRIFRIEPACALQILERLEAAAGDGSDPGRAYDADDLFPTCAPHPPNTLSPLHIT